MPSLPTLSSTLTRLPPEAYNAKLLKDSAERALEKEDASPSLPSLGGNWVHLHTLTIETVLQPLGPADEVDYDFAQDRYVRRVDRPKLQLYNQLATALSHDRDASIPLTILDPSFSLLRISKVPGGNPAQDREGGLHRITVHDPAASSVGMNAQRAAIVTYEQPSGGPRFRGVDRLRLGSSDQWFINSDAFDTRSWLHAVLAMDPVGVSIRKGSPLQDGKSRFKLLSSVSLTAKDLDEPVPDDEGNLLAESEITMTLSVDVYADLPIIAAGASDIINDFTGYILHSLLPARIAAYASEADARTAGIRDFFACLQPAPPLPMGSKPNDFQPRHMRSKLLPFQQRTVRKLIEREQRVEQNGRLGQDPAGTWTQLDVGEVGINGDDRYAYRRATGTVVKLPAKRPAAPSRKGKEKEVLKEDQEDEYGLTERDKESLVAAMDVSGVRGTMLCEEMGLGKTVEAVALLLLHRHPLSSAGDYFAKLHATSMAVQEAGLAERGESGTRGSGVDANGAGGSGGAIDASNRSSPFDEVETPSINLVKGPPDGDMPTFAKWLKEEEGRFSKTKVFDEASQLDVTEVAATLIVTPPSLLKQWINEIHHHAPAVRVCVYEGWKPLQDSARKKLAAVNKVPEKRNANNKRKKQEQERSATVEKYAKRLKGKGGAVVPAASTTRSSRQTSIASADLGTVVSNKDETIDVDRDDEGEKDMDDVSTLLQVTQREFLRYIRAHDVVITTYQDLSKDLTVALPVASRSRRSTVTYKLSERPRSPLLMAQWWRVCLDEVQMNSDSSAAADMVALIPRTNSLAISGTPAKADIKDLIGSLRFLRVPEIPNNPRLWHRLLQPAMRSAFEGLFRDLAIRTTKAEVQSEFNLPQQNRYVVPLTLSPIERHYYDDTLDRQRRIIGSEGAEGVNNATLRQCLLTLRQICTHIQVGHLDNQRAAGRRINLGNVLLKSMDEALKKMKADHATQYLNDTKLHMRTLVQRADLLQAQCQLALDGALELDIPLLLTQIERLYNTCIDIAEDQLPILRAELEKSLVANSSGAAGTEEDAIDVDAMSADDLSLDGAANGRGKKMSQQQRDRVQEVLRIKNAIRDVQLTLHQAWFMKGMLYGMQGEESKALEDAAWSKAEELRKEILAGHLRKAYDGIATFQHQIDTDHNRPAVSSVKDLQTDPMRLRAGIMSANAVASINDLFMVMNDNALLTVAWRDEIIELLKQPIEADTAPGAAGPEARGNGIDMGKQDGNVEQGESRVSAVRNANKQRRDENENQDQETADKDDPGVIDLYSEGLETQVRLEAYLVAYAAMLADRKEMMTESRSAIDQQEADRAKGGKRKTQRAHQAAEVARDLGLDLGEHAAIHDTLKPLLKERETIRRGRKDKCELPLKAYMIELNNTIYGTSNQMESDIAARATAIVKVYMKEQTDRLEALQKELSIFRAAYNKRGFYFAALQEISDTVRDREFKDAEDLQKQVNATQIELDEVMRRITASRVRGRYLAELGQKGDTGVPGAIEATGQQENPKDDCVICYGCSDDDQGLLLACGHFFCKSCFTLWEEKAGATLIQKACPSCRTIIDKHAIVRFKLPDEDEDGNLVYKEDDPSDTAEKEAENGADEDGSDGEEQVGRLDPATEAKRKSAAKRNHERLQGDSLKRLRHIEHAKRQRIEGIDMYGEYGTKIDCLIKSILLSRLETPNARHVVFSNWHDSLKIVVNALNANRIKYASFEANRGGRTKAKDIVDDFIKDKSITVFLLHAERESAGLTLTTCNTVHLLEPVLKHSFELQAIGRVDRLGQKHETSVYCYYTQETVEARILTSNVRDGTSIYLKPTDAESGMAENNMAHVAAGASKGGDLGASEGEDRDLELLSLIL